MLHRGHKMVAVSALVAISLCIGASAVLGISSQIPKEPIKWAVKATLPDHPLKPGEQFSLELTATIEEGWHLYSLDQAEGGPTPTRILMPADQPFAQDGSIDSAEPKSTMDPNFNLLTQYYEEQAIFRVPVKVAVNAPAGKSEVRVNVSFQTCNDELCLPPKTIKLGAEVNIAR